MERLLEVRNLCRRFGGLKAVENVSFSVKEGQIKAVIGPNGAGKTTLFNLVSGFLKPDSGTVLLDRLAVQDLPSYSIARKGMARTFQHMKLFPKMSALENVMVGRHIHGRAGFVPSFFNLPWTWSEERRMRREALDLMTRLDIENLAETEATSLAYGQQRMVELCRALACSPRLLLLDEPAAGLNMRETAEMAKMISRIRDMGITVLLVEHDMSLVMNISDEVAVLCYGQKIADDVPLAVQKNPEVVRVYLGEENAQDS